MFSENTEAEESRCATKKSVSTPEKRNISYASNIQPRRISSFAALHTLSRATLQSLQIIFKQSSVQSDITPNSNIRRYKLLIFQQ